MILNPDKYITDGLQWVSDFIGMNPITYALLYAGVVKLSKRYPWVSSLVEKFRSLLSRRQGG